ncbi:hypothetical protein CYLTODRAFT_422254 [Cylindrobasidium torrendii FP15055 ss-10]|uniref:Uncharacterized protein n=1 Tax=Cylindrobasidium torrendii FP15055 ss-10 TaxID=1314674 RepID=A0A0D7BBX8_9AGAR|nr:hypothetical protein CYLTODRAFT_422254 [Cylindrobasidium torrendii FP15055 ss-10]
MPHLSNLGDDTGPPRSTESYGRLRAVSRTFGGVVRCSRMRHFAATPARRAWV